MCSDRDIRNKPLFEWNIRAILSYALVFVGEIVFVAYSKENLQEVVTEWEAKLEV